ncbi:MAG: glutamine-hydrolyzing GMP synthase [Gammaproteobacteria bacterium]|nr:glutamine-hydrolyzing GMP synthase [Gammaproteobacteria bacterium]
MHADHKDRILIIDFGSQYTQLIARRVREIGVYCEIVPCTVSEKIIRAFAPSGIILSGGPESVTSDFSVRAPECVFTLGCPVLGICYGMQTMAAQLGGRVAPGARREFGYAKVSIQSRSRLLDDISDVITETETPLLDVWMSHGDHVAELPPEFTRIAATENCAIVAMANENKKFYALQFHPEVSHTRQGMRILERFVKDICECEGTWTIRNVIDESIQSIQKQVGDERVILALSGGVDSSVLAALLHRAIGKQLICVLVDTGLMRLNEIENIQTLFEKHLGIHLITVRAEERFLQALSGVTDPEQKRKIIGRLFIEIFDEEAAKITDAVWLAQGTIYPDVIESAAGSDQSHVIKSHHNVGGLPETMKLKLLEPLRELFKDEVRKMGVALGLPYELVQRHPFPGPGLAIRVMGEVLPEFLEIVRAADAILIEELRQQKLYDRVSQAFVVFLPVKSVGVQGDARHYDYVLSVRVVESIDFMTAHVAHLPHEFLTHVANRITNEVRHVSRVVYDISGKPPATIEWE